MEFRAAGGFSTLTDWLPKLPEALRYDGLQPLWHGEGGD